MTSVRQRLLIVTTGLGFGGAEAQLQQLARAFHADPAWEVEIASLLPLEGWAPQLAALGIPLHDLRMRRGVADPRAILRLARIVRRLRPHLVHAHMVHANLLCRVTRLVAPMPVLVCTAHSADEGGRRRELAYRLTDRLSDVTTQVSRTGAERYVRVGAVSSARIRFIPNGVDTDAYRPDESGTGRNLLPAADRSKFVFLAVGRVDPAKDYPNLAAALARVRREHPQATVVHLGTGPLDGSLRALLAEQGLADGFRLLGFRRDVDRWLAAADALVISSRNEGLPMVLLEAMSAGLPVVSTTVGGIPELVAEGENGFLAPPGDPQALARAMAAMLELTPARRRLFGERARATVVAGYGLGTVLETWRALYAELLARRGARP